MTQTVSLRYELGLKSHTYEPLEGIIPAPLAPELATYYPTSTKTWNYFDITSAASASQALAQLHDFIALEGPFDGVIAYSHGASFAATYIIQQATVQPFTAPPFKCAIFFSAARPADPELLARDELRFLDASTDGIKIGIPTTHVWGSNDNIHPGTWEHARDLSEATLREEVVHQEGHDIPGGKAQEALLEVAKAIRRTVARAEGKLGPKKVV
jgi:pimeloyl-ACP methyl ester carboxylesterase